MVMVIYMDELFNKLGIKIHEENRYLYERSITHASYVNENSMNKEDDYERLEFLGDGVLDLVMADYLYKTYNEEEGSMTKDRSVYVCEPANYKYATSLGLDKLARFGKGEEASGGRHKIAVIADMFEAFIGAVYLDQGYDFTKNLVLSIIVPYINDPEENFLVDYKSKLQESVQADEKVLEYKLINEEGPAHNKKFTVEVFVDGISFGVGTAGSKQKAQMEAAKEALSKLAK